MIKTHRKSILWTLVIVWVVLFHTTGIKPAVYGEFGPSVWEFNNYVDFTPDAVTDALSADKDVVIYFGANRCPTCTNFEKKILNEIDQIPTDVIIFAADIDRDTEAKQQYGVRSKSTTVYLWDDGEVLTTRVARDHNLGAILSTLEGLK